MTRSLCRQLPLAFLLLGLLACGCGGPPNQDPPTANPRAGLDPGEEPPAKMAKPIGNAVVSPDGRRAVFFQSPTHVAVWDLDQRAERLQFEHHYDYRENAIALGPNDRAALACVGGVISLRDLRTGQESRELKGHRSLVRCLAFAPDGRRLLSGSGDTINSPDNSMRLWDVATGRELLHFDEGHLGAVTSVTFTADGKTALSGGEDGTVRRWDVQAGAELACWKGDERQPVVALALSPDGKRVASVEQGGAVSVWELGEGKLLWKNALPGNLGRVLFSADNRGVFVCGFDVGYERQPIEYQEDREDKQGEKGRGHRPAHKTVATSWTLTLERWDAATGQKVAGSAQHEKICDEQYVRICSAAFFPDRKRLLLGGGDGSLQIRELP